MRGHCNFDPGTGGPAGFGRAAYGIVGEVGLNSAEGGAAGAVDEKAVESVTGAAARRGPSGVRQPSYRDKSVSRKGSGEIPGRGRSRILDLRG